MKTAHFLTRRVCAVLLCMTLLCGAIMGVAGFSVSAADTEIEKFSVDFSDLSALVSKGSYTEDGYYRSAATDTAINKWVSEHFDLYYNYETDDFAKRAYLGQPCAELNSTDGNDSHWKISSDGALVNSGYAGQYLIAGNSLNLKYNGDTIKLKNFEATVVFNTNENMAGSVYVAFHENVAGRFSWDVNGTDKTPTQQDAVLVATPWDARSANLCSGMVVRTYGETLKTDWLDGVALDADKFFSPYLVGDQQLKLWIRVLDTTVTMKLTDADDDTVVYYSGSDTVSNGYGTISVGVTGRTRELESIEVIELDDEGNAVDIGTLEAALESELSAVESYTVDFSELATLAKNSGATFTDGYYRSVVADTVINKWVDARFDLYNNYETDDFAQRAYLGQSVYELNSTDANDSHWKIGSNGTLLNSGYGGQCMWAGEALNLVRNGEPLQLKNFEASVKFNTNSNLAGTVYVAFHENVAGRFAYTANGSDLTPTQQDAVFAVATGDVGNGYADRQGIAVRTYGEDLTGELTTFLGIVPTEDRYKDASGADYGLGVDKDYVLTVRVVNGVSYTKLTDVAGTVTYYTGTDTVSDNYGTISVGVTGRPRGLYSIRVTELDDTGRAVNIGSQSRVSVNESTDTVNVIVGEGSELKAGSLIVTDVNGVQHIPTRVGFQTADNTQSEIYQVLNANGQPVSLDGATVTAEFYEPSLEQPNIGLIGTSVHTEKEGLRFIHRANITQGDDGWYMNFGKDGVKKVKDFGLLLVSSHSQGGKYAADPANVLVLENTLASQYDKEYSMLGATYEGVELIAKNTYYDISDSYVDIAIEIQNIVKGGGETDDLLTRLYVVLEDDSVIYGASADENYKNAGGLYTTETLPALVADNCLKTVGRQEIASDKIVMEYNNAAVTLYGELEGTVSMRVANTSSAVCMAHVVVDGDTANASTVLIRNGDTDITLCKGLEKSMHTIELIRSTCCDWPALELYSVTYSGTLSTPPARDLQIEFLGDSITCAVGAIKADGVYDFGSKWQDGFYSYAAITARNLNADASVLSLSGRTTSEVHAKFDDVKCNTDDGAWNLAANPQDIVVINLGTNDFWHNTTDGVINYDLAAQIDALLADVRNAYGEDTYIVWAYGMMPIADNGYIKTAVESYAAETNDTRILYCDMTSVVNSNGWGAHPNEAGHEAAAELLTAFLRENCM